jgi:hypothetical protein
LAPPRPLVLSRETYEPTQSRRHLRRHRLDPHAVDVAALPVTAEEIAEAAIGAAEAGAAIVRLHARNPADGRPDQSPKAFAKFLKGIQQRSSSTSPPPARRT